MEKFCKSPWNHMNINNGGQIRPCCIFRATPNMHLNPNDDSVNIFDFHKVAFEEVKQQGIDHPACSRCKNYEDVGVQSRRERTNRLPDSDTINFLDITFGNTCNLKCRMCRSMNSTKWLADELYLEDKGFSLPGRRTKKYVVPQTRLQQIIDHCNNFEGDYFYLEVKGGEPFVTDEFLHFIDSLNDKFKSICEMRVFSNGTTIDDKYINKLKTFKKIKYTLSLEATDKLYQYIRGSTVLSLDEVEKNLINIHQKTNNVEFGTSLTVCLYNIFDLQPLLDWMEKMHHPAETPNVFVNFVHHPRYLDPIILPSKYKQIAIDQYKDNPLFENVVKYLQGPNRYEDQEALLKQFFEFTNLLDVRRREDIYDVVPIFKDIRNEL